MLGRAGVAGNPAQGAPHAPRREAGRRKRIAGCRAFSGRLPTLADDGGSPPGGDYAAGLWLAWLLCAGGRRGHRGVR